MSPQPRRGSGKRAAIDFDEMVDKRLDEISAADLVRALEQRDLPTAGAAPEELTVRDLLGGGATALRWPEKKKVEREKWPLEKLLPEKFIEQFPEKKKFELEKLPFEKQMVEGPGDILTDVSTLGDRLSAIEAKLSQLG